MIIVKVIIGMFFNIDFYVIDFVSSNPIKSSKNQPNLINNGIILPNTGFYIFHFSIQSDILNYKTIPC